MLLNGGDFAFCSGRFLDVFPDNNKFEHMGLNLIQSGLRPTKVFYV